MSRRILRLLLVLGPLVAWCGLWAALWSAGVDAPPLPDPLPDDPTALYGTERPGAWKVLSGVALGELVVLYLVLWPFSARLPSWRRWLLAAALGAMWSMFVMATAMHGGSSVAIHALFILGVEGVCIAGLVASAVAEVAARRQAVPPL